MILKTRSQGILKKRADNVYILDCLVKKKLSEFSLLESPFCLKTF